MNCPCSCAACQTAGRHGEGECRGWCFARLEIPRPVIVVVPP